MKYFFVGDSKGGTHIVVAKSRESAKMYAQNSGLTTTTLYELEPNTFEHEGFLVSSK
ncbi:MAG: hypothetical protein VB065_14075 [Eubacteriales bacterium]|nr:hypothetical protein [Christensenellaceae bacterium]MEA5067163.1 hypothetical protein [Eubacteriales bacterium]